MQTTIQSQGVTLDSAKTSTAQKSSKTSFWEMCETNRFGIIPYVLIVIGCMGGIAAAFGAGNGSDPIQLSMVVFPCILALAFVFAVSPMRLIIITSSIAFLMEVLVLIL